MKTTVYLRVGYDKRRRKATFTANQKPTSAPLAMGGGPPLPTIAFALRLDLPDALFTQAEQVIAELTVPESAAQIAVEVKQ